MMLALRFPKAHAHKGATPVSSWWIWAKTSFAANSSTKVTTSGQIASLKMRVKRIRLLIIIVLL